MVENQQLLAKEVFSLQITNFRRERIIPLFKDETWSTDLYDKSSLSKYNNNYKSKLTVTDIFTKYIQNNTIKRARAKSDAEKNVRKLLNNSLYGRMCMNPLHFLQSNFLNDEEKIMKSMSKRTFKNIARYKDYSHIECIKKKIEYDSPVYVGVTILEWSKLHMYDVFYNILQPSLKHLQLHYMDTDSFVLNFSEGKVPD